MKGKEIDPQVQQRSPICCFPPQMATVGLDQSEAATGGRDSSPWATLLPARVHMSGELVLEGSQELNPSISIWDAGMPHSVLIAEPNACLKCFKKKKFHWKKKKAYCWLGVIQNALCIPAPTWLPAPAPPLSTTLLHHRPLAHWELHATVSMWQKAGVLVTWLGEWPSQGSNSDLIPTRSLTPLNNIFFFLSFTFVVNFNSHE